MEHLRNRDYEGEWGDEFEERREGLLVNEIEKFHDFLLDWKQRALDEDDEEARTIKEKDSHKKRTEG